MSKFLMCWESLGEMERNWGRLLGGEGPRQLPPLPSLYCGPDNWHITLGRVGPLNCWALQQLICLVPW